MSAFTVVGTSRLGVEPQCLSCGAGATVSFNWAFARERGSAEDRARVTHFQLWRPLRRGELFRCGICHAVWHLDGAAELMTQVSDDRLSLVFEWDRRPITLSPEQDAQLNAIGATPPDVYGNGAERRVTPCAVETLAGKTFNHAMVCVQLDAPVQSHMQFRLGSDISRIGESSSALPRSVREASSLSHEMRMGFSPTLVEMPDGRRFVLNGMTSFMVEEGYDARAAKVVMEGNFFRETPPPDFVQTLKDVIYFIVDGDPGWQAEEPVALMPAKTVAVRRGWLQKLLGRWEATLASLHPLGSSAPRFLPAP
jgi:hypothetical protein